MTGPSLEDLAARLTSRSVPKGAHLFWRGAKKRPNGAGAIRHRGQMVTTARAAYLAWIGPIPAGTEISQTPECGRRDCIAPSHLIAIDGTELRRRHQSRWQTPPGQCARGHAKAPGERCRICDRNAERARSHGVHLTGSTDAVDGTPLAAGQAEFIRIALDGREQLLTLTGAHAQQLRDILAPYIAAGRRASSKRNP